jgi:hypothetical protein
VSKLAEFLRSGVTPPATPATPATPEPESRKSRKSRSPAVLVSETQSQLPPCDSCDSCDSVPTKPPLTAEHLVTCISCLHFREATGRAARRLSTATGVLHTGTALRAEKQVAGIH